MDITSICIFQPPLHNNGMLFRVVYAFYFAYNNHWLYQPPFEKGGAICTRDSNTFRTVCSLTMTQFAILFLYLDPSLSLYISLSLSHGALCPKPKIGSYHLTKSNLSKLILNDDCDILRINVLNIMFLARFHK